MSNDIEDKALDAAVDKNYEDRFLSNNQDCKVDYFKILGLTKDSSLSDVDHVRHTHYKLAFKFHPDKNNGTQESSKVMASVNAAFDVIKKLIKNINNDKEEVCGAKSKFPVQNDFLREIDSKHDNFTNFFLTSSTDQEVSSPIFSKRFSNDEMLLTSNYDCEVDYFKVLGLTKDSSLSEVNNVRHTHYKLAFKFHPDKNGQTQESKDVMASINNAFDIAKALIENINSHNKKACSGTGLDNFLRDIGSKYDNFTNYFLTASADQEVSASMRAEPDAQSECSGNQADFTADVVVG